MLEFFILRFSEGKNNRETHAWCKRQQLEPASLLLDTHLTKMLSEFPSWVLSNRLPKAQVAALYLFLGYTLWSASKLFQEKKKQLKKKNLSTIAKTLYFQLQCYDKPYLLYLEEKLLMAGGKAVLIFQAENKKDESYTTSHIHKRWCLTSKLTLINTEMWLMLHAGWTGTCFVFPTQCLELPAESQLPIPSANQTYKQTTLVPYPSKCH